MFITCNVCFLKNGFFFVHISFFGLVLLLHTCRTNGTKICIVLMFMFDVYLSIKLKAKKKTFIIYLISHFKRRMENIKMACKVNVIVVDMATQFFFQRSICFQNIRPPPQKRIRIMKCPYCK